MTPNICENCTYFECVDIDGSLLEKGYCAIKDLYTYVEYDDTCDDFVLCARREEDIRMGM